MAGVQPNDQGDQLLSIVEMFGYSTGPSDGSINYKRDLYGAPTRNLDGTWKMRRKQIYLTVEQEDAFKRIAGDRRVPVAVVIREAMDAYLAAEHAAYDDELDFDDIQGTPADPIVQMGKLGGSGIRDGARNYKRDLYPERAK